MPQVSINLIHDLRVKHSAPKEKIPFFYGLRTGFLRAWLFTALKVLFIASFVGGTGIYSIIENNVALLDKLVRNDFAIAESNLYIPPRPAMAPLLDPRGPAAMVAAASIEETREQAEGSVASDNTIIINNIQNQPSALTESYVDSAVRYNLASAIASSFIVGNGSSLRGCLEIDENGVVAGTGRDCRRGGGGGGTVINGSGMAVGDAITSAIQGSVLFVGPSGVLAQDNANFFWDDTTDRLAISDITINGLAGGGTQCLQVDNTGALSGTGGSCGLGGGGDSLSVNGSAATDINFISSAANGTAPSVTWSLNTVPNPDEITLAIGVATGTEAGVVTTGAQTFAGNKTFSGSISASNLSGTNTGDQTITLTGDISGSGTGSFAATIQPDAVTLTTDTVGNYVQSVTNGSGISGANGGSEGAALTLALGPLNADWNQTGAFDIVLNNASSDLKILESAGGSFYGIFDVTDLSVSDKTYSFPNANGTVITTGNLTDITALGTITSGIWNGTALADTYVSDNLTSSIFVGSGSATNAIDLATAEVSGILPIANGGTNAATSQGAINNISQLTTAGDLLYFDGTNSTRLARGTDGQCLTSNITSIVWGACGSSGGMAIGDSVTSATQGSVLFAGASGVLAQDNSNFFWDDSSNELGVGTASPNSSLDVRGNVRIGNGNATQPGNLVVQQSDTSGTGMGFSLFNEATATNSISAIKTYGNNGAVNMQMYADGLGTGALGTPGGYLGSFTSHPIGFFTSNTERMRISATGNIGIGATSPNAPLDVRGQVRIGNGNATQPDNLVIQKNDTALGGIGLAVFNEATTTASISALRTVGNNGAVTMQMYADGLGNGPLAAAGGYLGSYSNHPIGLFTNNTERIRVTAAGNIGIGTTNPNGKLEVITSPTSSTSNALLVHSGSGNASSIMLRPFSGDFGSVISFNSTFDGTNGNRVDAAYGSYQLVHGTISGNFQLQYVGAGVNPITYSTGWALTDAGNFGVATTGPDRRVEINDASGNNLRLTYNDTNGSAVNYADFLMSSSGDLTIAPSGGDTFFGNSVSVTNQNTAGTTALHVNNAIATGTLNTGVLIEQSGGGTMTYALSIAENSGTIQDAIIIGGTVDNILNTQSIDITGGGTILGATGITSSGTITFSGLASVGTQCLQASSTGVISGTGSACGAGGGGMAMGGSITSATQGSILFAGASGVLAQDNSNFFWDDTGNQLGIGVNSSLVGKLHVVGSVTSSGSTAVAGTFSNLTLNNSTASGFQFGNRLIATVNGTTAGTEVGQLIRMIDNTTLNAGQVVRGLEVQAFSGTNVNGTNTGIASYGYTFGIQGTTTAQAASQATPAGVFADLDNGSNPTVGNALRTYTDNATSATLVNFYQETSAYTGTGLEMNFGNNSGSFTGNFMDLKVSGVSKFAVNQTGSVTIGSADLGDGIAGPVVTLGRNTNGTNTGAGSINFQSKAGAAGYVWQDNAGNMRINTAAPSNANDTAGTVIGTQTSTRSTKQDIVEYTDFATALQMVAEAPLHSFRYIKDVEGYGEGSILAKTRIGFIADEVPDVFMWGNAIDQVSVNGILMASVKALNDKVENVLTQALVIAQPALGDAPLTLRDHLYLSEDSVGQAKILAGSRIVRITFSKPYEYQPIPTATPSDFIDGAYRVTDVDATGFSIELKEEQEDDVIFNWHAFAGPAAKLSVSDGTTENVELVLAEEQTAVSAPDIQTEVLGEQTTTQIAETAIELPTSTPTLSETETKEETAQESVGEEVPEEVSSNNGIPGPSSEGSESSAAQAS